MRVKWTEAARRDRRDLIGFLETKSLVAAERMDKRVYEALHLLSAFPRSGKLGRLAETRELVISDTPYIAVYVVRDDVTILRLLHAAQQWPPTAR